MKINSSLTPSVFFSGVAVKWLASVGTAWLLIPLSVAAADFDCAKASTNVEKAICADAELSSLDEQIGRAYREALRRGSSDEQSSLRSEERAWLKARDACGARDHACLVDRYRERVAILMRAAEATSATSQKQGPEERGREASKAEAVKEIMKSHKFHYLRVPLFEHADRVTFCEGFMEAFKAQRGIEYVEPDLRSERYDDPIWAPYKKRCPDDVFSSYLCETKIAEAISSEPEAKRRRDRNALCPHFRGTENFKLFVVDLNDNPRDGKEQVFYDEAREGPLNKSGATIRRTNGGYSVIDLDRCEVTSGVVSHDPYSYFYRQVLRNLNGVILYRGKHYIFDLYELEAKDRKSDDLQYYLLLAGYQTYSHKVTPRLGSVCSFSTVIVPPSKSGTAH